MDQAKVRVCNFNGDRHSWSWDSSWSHTFWHSLGSMTSDTCSLRMRPCTQSLPQPPRKSGSKPKSSHHGQTLKKKLKRMPNLPGRLWILIRPHRNPTKIMKTKENQRVPLCFKLWTHRNCPALNPDNSKNMMTLKTTEGSVIYRERAWLKELGNTYGQWLM